MVLICIGLADELLLLAGHGAHADLLDQGRNEGLFRAVMTVVAPRETWRSAAWFVDAALGRKRKRGLYTPAWRDS